MIPTLEIAHNICTALVLLALIVLFFCWLADDLNSLRSRKRKAYNIQHTKHYCAQCADQLGSMGFVLERMQDDNPTEVCECCREQRKDVVLYFQRRA